MEKVPAPFVNHGHYFVLKSRQQVFKGNFIAQASGLGRLWWDGPLKLHMRDLCVK